MTSLSRRPFLLGLVTILVGCGLPKIARIPVAAQGLRIRVVAVEWSGDVDDASEVSDTWREDFRTALISDLSLAGFAVSKGGSKVDCVLRVTLKLFHNPFGKPAISSLSKLTSRGTTVDTWEPDEHVYSAENVFTRDAAGVIATMSRDLANHFGTSEAVAAFAARVHPSERPEPEESSE
jgi:hypothetical protein